MGWAVYLQVCTFIQPMHRRRLRGRAHTDAERTAANGAAPEQAAAEELDVAVDPDDVGDLLPLDEHPAPNVVEDRPLYDDFGELYPKPTIMQVLSSEQ